jgi:lycopene cyclase domain-containing protein
MTLTYLILLLACFIFPCIFILTHRNSQLLKDTHLKVLNLTVVLSAIPFILWDYIAISRSHWTYNPAYTIGWKIANIPIEEFLFFLLVPQSCLLIWVALTKYNSWKEFSKDLSYHLKTKNKK